MNSYPFELSPDCRSGKHGSCSGDSWDAREDKPMECPCACHAMKDPPVYASDLLWGCPTCGLTGTGVPAMLEHAGGHVDVTVTQIGRITEVSLDHTLSLFPVDPPRIVQEQPPSLLVTCPICHAEVREDRIDMHLTWHRTMTNRPKES